MGCRQKWERCGEKRGTLKQETTMTIGILIVKRFLSCDVQKIMHYRVNFRKIMIEINKIANKPTYFVKWFRRIPRTILLLSVLRPLLLMHQRRSDVYHNVWAARADAMQSRVLALCQIWKPIIYCMGQQRQTYSVKNTGPFEFYCAESIVKCNKQRKKAL